MSKLFPVRRYNYELTVYCWNCALKVRVICLPTRSVFIRLGFRVVDGDKNGYLSQSEFMQLNLPDTDYKKVDQSKDEMLTVEELTDYLIKDTAAVQDQVVMTVENDGKSLFEILDADLDQRLSPRELQRSLQRVKEYDGNQDQSLDTSELRGHLN